MYSEEWVRARLFQKVEAWTAELGDLTVLHHFDLSELSFHPPSIPPWSQTSLDDRLVLLAFPLVAGEISSRRLLSHDR